MALLNVIADCPGLYEESEYYAYSSLIMFLSLFLLPLLVLLFTLYVKYDTAVSGGGVTQVCCRHQI
jgi:hypothetical protein